MLWLELVNDAATQLFTGITLDSTQHGHIMRFDQADGGSPLACTPCAADAVNIDIRRSWQIDVDDMAHIRQIDTARRDIGCDQYIDLFVAEAANGFDPLLLLHLATDPGTVDATGLKLSGELSQALPGLDEQDAAFNVVTA